MPLISYDMKDVLEYEEFFGSVSECLFGLFKKEKFGLERRAFLLLLKVGVLS